MLAVSIIFSASFVFAQEFDQGFLRAQTNTTISLDVKGMDIVDVLKIIADKGKLNFSISGNVSGRVTLFLKEVNIWDALDIVLASGELAYEEKGNVIYIMTDRDYTARYGQKFADKREIKVFNLKYAKVAKVGAMFSQLVSNIGKVIINEPTNTLMVIDIPEKIAQMEEVVEKIDKPLQTGIFELQYLPAKDVKESVNDILTKEVGTLKVDEASNKLIVMDYPDKIKEVTTVLKAFDERPAQVLIDAQIIEIKPFKKFYAGINWDYWIKNHFRIAGSFAIPSGDLTEKISIGTIGTILNKQGDYKIIADFLETFGETKILSSPRILVLNNQEAKIVVATKEAYITTKDIKGTDGTIKETQQEVNFEEVGVKLYVTPTINKEKVITLKIRPEVSSAERKTLVSADKKTEVPIKSTSEAETTVIVKDGVSIFMGGLRKTNDARETRQVPVLGNIPFLGTAFRSKKDEAAKNDLVIILTPQIVSGEKPVEGELQEKIQKETNLFGINQGALVREQFDLRKSKVSEELKEQIHIKAAAQEKNNEYDYYSYNLQVVDRVKETAGLYKIFEENTGQIKVRFSLSKDGSLAGEPEVVFSEGDESLENVAKEIVRKSAPFPPFSAAMGETALFEILITL